MKINISDNALLWDSLQETAYSLQKSDLEQGASVMANAFRDDPAIRYLLGGETIGADDWRYFLTVLKAVYGKCVMLSTDKTVQDLLILFPPKLKTVPSLRFLLNGGIGLYRYFGMTLFSRTINYENNCKRIKDLFLTPDIWYCMCFVVLPEKQGQGTGSRLMKPALHALDEHHISLYLETHKEINTHIYKHFGFDVVDISTIPGTGRTQYAMLRPSNAWMQQNN